MGLQQGLFAVKLRELEQEYGRLQSRIHVFQEKSADQTRQELDRLQDEYRERALLLEECVRSSRSPAMAALAQAQLEYGRRAGQILKKELSQEMSGRNGSSTADQAEAATLFAEHAIDFATLAMYQALIAAMTALVLQQQSEQPAPETAKKVRSDSNE